MMGHRNPEPKLGRIPSLIKCNPCPLLITRKRKKTAPKMTPMMMMKNRKTGPMTNMYNA